MKLFFMAAALFVGIQAQAAPMTTSTVSKPTPVPALFATPAQHRMHFTTNVADLTNGKGNAAGDFFLSNQFAVNFRYLSSSAKEKVKKRGREDKITVDRTIYGLGGSFYVFGGDARRNLVITPFMAFGSKKDAVDTETLNGIGLKATALMRLTKDLTGEAGLVGNTTEDGNFRGDAYLGIGFLF